MARVSICNVCKKPKEIVNKLFIGPSKNSYHSAYTHHADLCADCTPKVLELFQFAERKKYAKKPPTTIKVENVVRSTKKVK